MMRRTIGTHASAATRRTKHEECTVCGAKRSENTVIEKLSKSGEETSLTPKTGDGSHVLRWAVLLAVSGGAMSGTVLLGKKKKDS